MLERVDRVQLVVRDREAAARTFAELLGAKPVGESRSRYLGARRTVLALGAGEVELCQPSEPGPAEAHLARWGEGLLAAGVSVANLTDLYVHLAGEGIEFVEEDEQTFLEPAQTGGALVVVSPTGQRVSTALVRGFVEVTHTIAGPWTAVAQRYTEVFRLDPARFAPIRSARFGYEGTLALFAPDRRDRIEIAQVTDPASAMGRWVARRGDSLYMASVEADDVGAIVERLEQRGAAWTPRGGDPARERDGLWIHPKALHGLLLGVARTGLA
jgi:catechol 2,3-dioxygenase-like lactoylglutathione lyase family enzyme